MMKKANEVLPHYKNGVSSKENPVLVELFKSRNGKAVERFLAKCDAGLSPAEFERLEKSKDFDKVLDALVNGCPNFNKAVQAFALKSYANTNRLLKKLDGTIPWEAYLERFRCLKMEKMVDEKCAGSEACWNCKTLLRRTYYQLIEMILTRHEILAEENGIFADQLITAIELGVPFSRITSYMGSTLDVAIKVLQKHFPYVSKDFLSQCANEYLESWHRLDSSSEKSTSDFEVASVKN